MMTLEKAVKILNKSLRKKKPETFSSTWIFVNTHTVYMYIRKNVRTENNDIDWDLVTSFLDKKFQRRWVHFRKRKRKSYENSAEVEIILNKYQNKLYTFIAPLHKEDRDTRHKIIVAFVRIAQKGNVLAYQELVKWLGYVIDEWIEKYYPLYRWKGYKDGIEEKINCCIRGYRYTGSFTNYLFRTLELSARGLQYFRVCSLDTPLFDGETTIIDYVFQDIETKECHLFEKM
jgi:hypothetical protein